MCDTVTRDAKHGKVSYICTVLLLLRPPWQQLFPFVALRHAGVTQLNVVLRVALAGDAGAAQHAEHGGHAVGEGLVGRRQLSGRRRRGLAARRGSAPTRRLQVRHVEGQAPVRHAENRRETAAQGRAHGIRGNGSNFCCNK